MRRKDRELADLNEIFAVVSKENVCNVAFCDGMRPYVVPMNYGARLEGGKLVLYFHGAKEGTKLALMKKNPQAAFSIISGETVKLDTRMACKSSAAFESVCGSGRAELLGPEMAKEALLALMNHIGMPEEITYSSEQFGEREISSVAVWRIVADEVTGKRHE